MSAIWGIVSYQNKSMSNLDIIMQTPYREKCKIDAYHSEYYKNAYMGCGVQYITKESHKERLPIVDSEHHFILTADCIIDNRHELLEKLALTDASLADGELIYHAYLKWGIQCVKHLRGLYTIAVWDEDTKTLYLANDRVSARCLYYYRHEDTVLFSTLIAPILAVHPDIPFHEMYFMDYLAAPTIIPTVVVPETPYKGVYKLPQATILTITQTSIQQETYWTPAEPLPDCNCKTAEEYGQYFRKLMTECVSDAIRAEGQKGIALSSGLDSSTVGTIAADLIKSKQEDLLAYTYVPYEKVKDNTKHKIYNETKDVHAIVAMHPNIKTHFLCNKGQNSINSIPDGLDTLEIPFKAFVNYPNLNEIYGTAAAAGCKVVLTGQFGNSTISYGNIDPIFYDLYKRRKYVTLLKAMTNFAKHMKISRKRFLPSYMMYLKEADRECRKGRRNYKLADPFLSDAFKEKYPLFERFDKGDMYVFSNLPNPQAGYQQQLKVLSGSTYMGEWDTKLGLKHGIVLRDPTRDSRMLSFCYHLPYEYFVYQGTTKWLIRGNMKDMLPAYILDNWDRHGIQNDDWPLRVDRDWGKLRDSYLQAIRSKQLEPYIDSKKILSIVTKDDFTFASSDEYQNVYLFSAYILSLFLER